MTGTSSRSRGDRDWVIEDEDIVVGTHDAPMHRLLRTMSRVLAEWHHHTLTRADVEARLHDALRAFLDSWEETHETSEAVRDASA